MSSPLNAKHHMPRREPHVPDTDPEDSRDEQIVYLEGCAMFRDIFWKSPEELTRARAITTAPAGTARELNIADFLRRMEHCPPGDRSKDEFALVERGRSVVYWLRGRADEARYTVRRNGDGSLYAVAYPSCQAFLGCSIEAGAEVSQEVASMLSSLEIDEQSDKWSGGALRFCKVPVYRGSPHPKREALLRLP